MKKKNKNNQLPPHLYNYWVKDTLKDGAVIKKKLIIDIKIIVNKDNQKSSKIDDDDIKRFFMRMIRKIKIDLLIFSL
jgi:hypothetical protein